MDNPGNTYLVLSRGRWNSDLSPQQIQQGIDAFYVWFDQMHAQGRMQAGSRLQPDGITVTAGGLVTDGPYSESKEIVGGYWHVRAGSLQEAAQLLAASPVLPLGLQYEVRPLEEQRCDAFRRTTETPLEHIGSD